MHSIINYFVNVPASQWAHWLTTLGAFLGGGGLIASALQYLKRRHKWESKQLIHGVLILFSFIGAASNYLLTHAATSPLPTIFGNGSKLLAAAVIVHRFVVSPLSTKLEQGIVSLVEDASNYRALTAPQKVTPPESETEFQA